MHALDPLSLSDAVVPHGRPTRRSPGETPLIRFEEVTKRFGEAVAVDRVSLDIFGGEFFSLLGPSGCGKSTLLRLLAGFEQPDAGRILLDGQDLTGVPPHRRPLNMMFQSYALFPHLTVAGNVAFGLKQDRLPKPEIAARVQEMLRLVRMEPCADRYPAQISGGQRQRVALARALAKRPKVLLLDEPLAALDRKLREETQSELMDIQERLGTTFLVVTHDQQEAMTVSHRLAVMDAGRIAQLGPPEEVYKHPLSRFVAGFIGDANILEGAVVSAEGGFAHVTGLAGKFFAQSDGVEAVAGRSVAVMVRPEKVDIARQLPAVHPANLMEGTVAEAGYLGGVTVYKLRLTDGTMLRVARTDTAPNAEPAFVRDERVFAWFLAEAALILDR